MYHGCSRAMTRPAGRVSRSSKDHEWGRVWSGPVRSGPVGSGRVGSGGVRNLADRVGYVDPIRPDPQVLTRLVEISST